MLKNHKSHFHRHLTVTKQELPSFLQRFPFDDKRRPPRQKILPNAISIIALAFGLITLEPAISRATTVNVGGTDYTVTSVGTYNSYNIYSINGSYNALSTLLNIQPWWGPTGTTAYTYANAFLSPGLQFSYGIVAPDLVLLQGYYLIPNSVLAGNAARTSLFNFAFVYPPPSFGPDAANTLAALTANGYQVRDALTQRAAAITNAMDYDCRDFSAQNMCMSFQARYTGFDSMSDGAGVLTAAYRLDPNVRIGAFIDQRAVQGKKTGIDYSGDMPTVGAFLGYTQHPDGTGLQGKLALAGNTGKITATRDASLANTEAGSGKSNLNSWAVGGEVGWGMILGNKVLTTPYLGMRYTDVTRAAYTENTTSDVTSPLSYAGYYQRQTTVTAGVRFAGLLTDVIGYQIGIGGDYDVGRSANHYSGTSAISGLETFSVNTNTTTNRVRANAAAGLSYAIDKTQKLTTSISVRQQAYSTQPSVTAMAGYQISF